MVELKIFVKELEDIKFVVWGLTANFMKGELHLHVDTHTHVFIHKSPSLSSLKKSVERNKYHCHITIKQQNLLLRNTLSETEKGITKQVYWCEIIWLGDKLGNISKCMHERRQMHSSGSTSEVTPLANKFNVN